jgi:hypothetical protein
MTFSESRAIRDAVRDGIARTVEMRDAVTSLTAGVRRRPRPSEHGVFRNQAEIEQMRDALTPLMAGVRLRPCRPIEKSGAGK